MGSTQRVYLLGDSITQGLGSKKINFENELSRNLGKTYEVFNLAYTGKTIDYALSLIEEGKVCLDDDVQTTCVILHGNVDAQIRPSRTGKIFPHIPQRYQSGGGMLMPRPFYSQSFVKRAGQHVDNGIRKILSSLIKRVDGEEQWVSIDDFAKQYEKLVSILVHAHITTITCSCVFIDEKLFPGSPRQYELFNERIAEIASVYQLPYLDFYQSFKEHVERNGWDVLYNKDHFHPNGEGYCLMAEKIAASILSS